MLKRINSHSIVPLLWVMVFDHTSLNITFPVLTLLFFDVHSSLFTADTSHAVRSMWYGFCVSIPHFINLITTPLLSSLSDEYGRKKILLLGTFGAFIFALIGGLGVFCGMLSLLFLGRIIQGAFSRTNPIAQAVIGDLSTKELKVRHMGYLQTSISIGACLGPVIGGYFANKFLFAYFNFSLPYFIAAILGAISFLLTLFIFTETLEVKRTHFAWEAFHIKHYQTLFKNKKVLQISIILLLSQISWSLYYQFIPPILKTNLHFSASQLGMFVGLIAFWLAIATTFGIKFLEKVYNSQQILLLSLYAVLIGLLVTLCCSYFPGWAYGVWLGALPTALGDVIAYSCIITFYSNVVAKNEQGKVMGVCFIIVALIWALTAMLGGLVMTYHVIMPLLIAPIGILLAIVVTQRKSFHF